MTTRLISFSWLFSIVLAVTGVLVSEVSNAQILKEQIVGTWTAVSQYVDQDGKKLEPFGPNPKGVVVYDANGRFVLAPARHVT